MTTDILVLAETIAVFLILIAMVVEIVLSWRWHKEVMEEARKDKKR